MENIKSKDFLFKEYNISLYLNKIQMSASLHYRKAA